MKQTLALARSLSANAALRFTQPKTYDLNLPKPGSPLTASLPNLRVVHKLRISSAREKNGASSRHRLPRAKMRATTLPQRQRQNHLRPKGLTSKRWKRGQNRRPVLEQMKYLLANGCPSSLPRPTHNNDPDPNQLAPKTSLTKTFSMPPPPQILTIPLSIPRWLPPLLKQQSPMLLLMLRPRPRQVARRGRARQSKRKPAPPNYLVEDVSSISRARTRGLPFQNFPRSPSRRRRQKILKKRVNGKGRSGRFASDSGDSSVAITNPSLTPPSSLLAYPHLLHLEDTVILLHPPLL